MKNFDELHITSNTNPDWNGTWTNAYLRKEMKELVGLETPTDKDMVEYVFDHVFDEPADRDVIQKVVVENLENIRLLYMDLNNGRVKIKFSKWFK